MVQVELLPQKVCTTTDFQKVKKKYFWKKISYILCNDLGILQDALTLVWKSKMSSSVSEIKRDIHIGKQETDLMATNFSFLLSVRLNVAGFKIWTIIGVTTHAMQN